jgi:hypothetical protein
MKHSFKHPYKAHLTLKKDNPDKIQLRKDLELATIEYLKTNKIEYQNDSPNGKVTSVRVSELGSYSDSPEFYYLEDSLDNHTLT